MDLIFQISLIPCSLLFIPLHSNISLFTSVLSTDMSHTIQQEASLPHPKEPGFFTDTGCNANKATIKEELQAVNLVTITIVGGR